MLSAALLSEPAPAEQPRPTTMAERLAAAAARVPEDDLAPKPKAGGKKGKKAKKGDDGAATAGVSREPAVHVQASHAQNPCCSTPVVACVWGPVITGHEGQPRGIFLLRVCALTRLLLSFTMGVLIAALCSAQANVFRAEVATPLRCQAPAQKPKAAPAVEKKPPPGTPRSSLSKKRKAAQLETAASRGLLAPMVQSPHQAPAAAAFDPAHG